MRKTDRHHAMNRTGTALCGALSLFSAPALAQDRSYDIAAGDLKAALRAYEATSGLRIDVSDEALKGRTTRGARIVGPAREALRTLLIGTGLKPCPGATGTALVMAAAPCPRTGAGQADTTAAAAHAGDIVVTATAVSHLAERTRSGTRMDADPLTLPISVSTVKQELIQRQQALTITDIVSNISGVTGGIQGSASIRGFSGSIMRNGSLGADGRSNNLPIIAIASVEAVKGPEAIIAGIGAGYGGTVNIISKTPPPVRTGEFNATLGTRGYRDMGMDLGGPVNADKSVLMRLVAATQRSDRTLAGFDGARSDYVAPSVTLRNPGWGTAFTAQYEIQDLRTPPDTVVVTNGTRLTSDLPISRLGEPGDGLKIRSRTATLSFEQRIVENWSAALNFSAIREHRAGISPATFYFAFPTTSDAVTLRTDGTSQADSDNYKAELRGRFKTGPIEHKLLVSYDRIDRRTAVFNATVGVVTTDIATGVSTDAIATLGPAFGVPGPSIGGGQVQRETGVLGLDQMTWGDLVVLAGVRRLHFQSRALNGTTLPAFNRTLPSFGAVYRITKTLSIYGNASRGFVPNLGLRNIDGELVPPEQAQQYEVGVKALLWDEKVATSLSAYTIQQENVAAADQANPFPAATCLSPNLVCYVTIPGQRSRGVEFDLSGQVLPRLEVRGNYRYAEIDLDTATTSAPLFAPHEGSLWVTYNLQADKLGGWIGGDVKVRSAQRGGSLTTPRVSVPGQVRTDLSAGYDARNWSLLAGVKNVFDARLYSIQSGAFGTGIVEQPREVYVTLRYHLW